MILVYKDGVVDFDTILRNTGSIEFAVDDYSRVSREVYADVTDDNCFRLKVKTGETSFFKDAKYSLIYCAGSMEAIEDMKRRILLGISKGTPCLNILVQEDEA